MFVSCLGLGIDSNFGDESFSLEVPIFDDRIRELDVIGNNQRGDVWQNVALEEIYVVKAVGFNLGVESEPAVYEFRDGFEGQVFKGNGSSLEPLVKTVVISIR